MWPTHWEIIHLQRLTQSKGYTRTENLKKLYVIFPWLYVALTVCIKDIVRASPVIKPSCPILHHHLWLISLYQNKTKELKWRQGSLALIPIFWKHCSNAVWWHRLQECFLLKLALKKAAKEFWTSEEQDTVGQQCPEQASKAEKYSAGHKAKTTAHNQVIPNSSGYCCLVEL